MVRYNPTAAIRESPKDTQRLMVPPKCIDGSTIRNMVKVTVNPTAAIDAAIRFFDFSFTVFSARLTIRVKRARVARVAFDPFVIRKTHLPILLLVRFEMEDAAFRMAKPNKPNTNNELIIPIGI